MRYSREHSEKTRRAILDAAARTFRERGAAGAGVDAVASSASVTSGAIYRQFRSKNDLFAAVVGEGMDRLVAGLSTMRDTHGSQWREHLVKHYVGASHVASAGSGCILPSLAIDVGRGDEDCRTAFDDGLERAVGVLAAPGQGEELSRDRALLLLASMLGSVILARATGDEDIRQALERALLAGDPT